MLVIDNDMLKLSKMQEKLLKVTDTNREENLNNYKKTVTEIDTEAFNSILEKLKHIDKHNQTLEDEFQFLEDIKSSYDQLTELQLTFKNVCESYGDLNLKLSDLSQLNIEYIENRISAINGYLVNLRNIEINKKRIQELNEQFGVESKKKDYLSSKLEQLESVLKNSFLNAEGRLLVDGKLQYTSVVEEYKKLEIDLRMLLDDATALNKMLAQVEKEKTEVEEKFRTAEICYSNFPNAESKQILDEIRIDYSKVRYRLMMLKILNLLSFTYTDYDSFKRKREELLDLIKYRLSCLESLGEQISIDPFARTKTREQLNDLMTLTDNSKIINKIGKELSQLTDRTEDMINQNSDYLITLADTKELLVSKVGINDIDVSSVELSLDEESKIDSVDSSRTIEDNQVVDVRDTSGNLNMSIVKQKTDGVIKRVNQMMNDTSLSVSINNQEIEVYPELVIIPRKFEEKSNQIFGNISQETDSVFVAQEESERTVQLDKEDEKEELQLDLSEDDQNSDIFETVEPFSEPIRFETKTDDSLESEQVIGENLSKQELEAISQRMESDMELQYNGMEELPDAFWIIEPTSEEVEEIDEEDVLSFDDQINMLLSDQDSGKTRKLETTKNTRKVA